MKKSLTLAGVAAIATLSACAETPTEPGASAAAPFVGKSIVNDSGTSFNYLPDGTITGVFRGAEPIAGTYTSTAREICSTYASPEQLTGQEYCSVPEISGSTVIFNRRDGSQSPAYQIQG